MAKFQGLHEAVAENLKDGDSVAFEGFTHLNPHAALISLLFYVPSGGTLGQGLTNDRGLSR
jgi:hypothetical protein